MKALFYTGTNTMEYRDAQDPALVDGEVVLAIAPSTTLLAAVAVSTVAALVLFAAFAPEPARVEKGRPVEEPPMEWRSFRSLSDPRTVAR